MKKDEKSEKSNSCEVCKDALHKYKCPRCNTKYCSIPCFKIHKDDICETETNRRRKEQEGSERGFKTHQLTKLGSELEEGEVVESRSEGESDDEDRVSTRSLEQLGDSRELRNMLCNKHLRQMMQEIDASQDPGKLLVDAMQIPIFTEFVDECLRIVEPQQDHQMES